jgi:hypothetical protein
MLGYANNFDMLRVQTWFGLVPRYQGELTREATPDAPLRFYEFTGQVDYANGYLTSELLLVYLAVPISVLKDWLRDASATRFDLAVLGLVCMLSLVGTGLWISFLYGRLRRSWAVLSALIFSIVICDPINTLWMNTFYSEFAAFLSLYASIGIIYYLYISRTESYLMGLLAAIALFALGMSKVQHMLLPLAMTCIFLIAARGRFERRFYGATLGLLLLSSTLSIAIQNAHVRRAGYMSFVRHANAIDTYFGALLPSMAEPLAGIRALGVPDTCYQYVGMTWYAPEIGKETCPEIVEVPRHKILSLVVRDPLMPVRLLRRALVLGRPWLITELGQVEGIDGGQVTAVSPMFWSLSTAIDSLPFSGFVILKFVSGATFLHALLMVIFRSIKHQASEHVFTAFLGVSWITITISSLAGDGLVHLPKHIHLEHSLTIIGMSIFVIRMKDLLAIVLAALQPMAALPARARSSNAQKRLARAGRWEQN